MMACTARSRARIARWAIATTALAAWTGCNNTEIALFVEQVPIPDDESCALTPGEDEFAGLIFDAQRMNQMIIPTEVRNTMVEGAIELAPTDPPVQQSFANAVTPLRFDFRWECDSNGFTAGQGPLIVPAFSIDNPFCLDTRDEANSNFAGFDVVSATGSVVEPGDTAIWLFRPITPQLGAAMRTVFRLAEESEACCQAAGGCQNVPQNTNLTQCQDLQTTLNSVAPGQFSLQQAETVNIWRPYYIYTASYAAEPQVEGGIPNFPMRLRGVYEGITSSGDLITSTEFSRDIGFCLGAQTGMGDRCTAFVTELCLDN